MDDENVQNPSLNNNPQPLFTWQGDESVLLAERKQGRWMLAQGRVEGDRFVDIERWAVANPNELLTQVRRLARQATGNLSRAHDAESKLRAWLVTQR